MWIQHKARDGDTLASILKQYKIKDPALILKNPQNKRVAARLKKGQPLKAGEIVMVPDPRAKVYVLDGPKGKQVLNEKQYKAHVAEVHRAMDRAFLSVRLKHEYAIGRHDAQRAINSDQWFVSTVVEAFNSVPEPTSQRRNAESLYKKLSAAAKGRKYKDFQKLIVASDKASTVYRNAVNNWVNGLIGTADTTVDVLKGVRTAGEIAGTLAVVTVTAPVSLPATLAVGAAASSGTGLVFDSYEQVGRAVAGEKLMSATEMRDRAIANAITGAAGAGIARGIMAVAGKPLAQAIASNRVVSQQATRLLSGRLTNRLFQAEIQQVADQLAKGGTKTAEAYIEAFIKEESRIVLVTMTKFFTRLGVGTFSKTVGASKRVLPHIQSWMGSNPKKISGKSQEAVGKLAAGDLARTRLVDEVYDDVLDANQEAFRKELRNALTERGKQLSKK